MVFAPIALGTVLWLVVTVFAVALLLGGGNARARILGLLFSVGSFVMGIAPWEFVWTADNQTVVSAQYVLPQDGSAYAVIFFIETGILLLAIGSLIEWSLSYSRNKD